MHTNVTECTACQAKLLNIHPTLCNWLVTVRAKHPDCHIAWGYRGKEDQEEAFRTSKSKAHYGQSAHNKNPSEGVDLFRLTLSGGAAFEIPWYREEIAPLAKAAGLVWGGDWKSIKDYDHFELPSFKPFVG